MSKKTQKDAKKSQVEEVNVDEEVDSPWYYFYSQGCGWCKKSEPIVDQLISEGHDILKLDVSDPENQSLNKELQKEYNIQCGTPWFINESTGKGICGFREKDILETWLSGEDIPAPPRPKGTPPRTPLMDASKQDLSDWKKAYDKWLKENDHLPDNMKKSADDMLSMPRPKTDPPKPPQPNMNDADLDKWGESYQKWVDTNGHLPNLQPASVILQRIKAQRATAGGVQNAAPAAPDNSVLNTLDAKVQALEVKVDKIISHFGIK
jgi:thiol-disulfide isomerase/thioredoxin